MKVEHITAQHQSSKVKHSNAKRSRRTQRTAQPITAMKRKANHLKWHTKNKAHRCNAKRTTSAQTTPNHCKVKLNQDKLNIYTCMWFIYMCTRTTLYEHVCTFIHTYVEHKAQITRTQVEQRKAQQWTAQLSTVAQRAAV